MILCDTHIHLGAGRQGLPIKVSASRNLTLETIPRALRRHGADLGAVVDLGTARGLDDLETALAAGTLAETADGGFADGAGTVIVGALEAEFRLMDSGPFHLLAYAPGLDGVRQIARVYRESVKNPSLSTQRMYLAPEDFRRSVEGAGGIVVVAHAFTPHRGLFGVGLTLADAFSDRKGLGLELGLSADVEIARHVGAIAGLGLMGGSDAHGPDTVGRELNALGGATCGFSTLRRLAAGEAETIYGMNPAFGKYHRTFCLVCDAVVGGEPPQFGCPADPAHRVVTGVLDRALSMAPPTEPRRYPAYVYQLPLGLLPGFGPAARARLVEAFGSIHRGLHDATVDELVAAVGSERTSAVLAMRRGEPPGAVGGGGRWGKSERVHETTAQGKSRSALG